MTPEPSRPETQLKACLIYVRATEQKRDPIREKLEEAGYSVCAVKAELEDAVAAQAGEIAIPEALAECIRSADLCVFLLPEIGADDGCVGLGAGLASQLGKRVVGIVAGARADYPRDFETAGGMIRQDSERFEQVIRGEDVWEEPDRSIIRDRTIKHIRCQ
jgi:hypothetical protein